MNPGNRAQDHQRPGSLFGHMHANAVRFDHPVADFVHGFTFDELGSSNRFEWKHPSEPLV